MKRARMPWHRDLPPATSVDPARFQDEDEPFPRHWRRFPEPWPPGAVTDPDLDPDLAESLTEALDDLPAPWREVMVETDVRHRDPADVAAERGLDPAQERAIRNQARAALRESLARRLTRRGRR